MMKLIVFIFISGLSTPVRAATKCEKEVARGQLAADTYLRTVKSGLQLGVINNSDLEWAADSQDPVNPVRTGKNIYSLSVRNGIRDVLPLLHRKEWKTLKVQLQKLLEDQSADQVKVDNAKENAAPIYTWKKLKFKPEGIVTAHFVATNGEVFVASRDDTKTYLAEIHQSTVHSLNLVASHPELHDFFETKRGQVLFASMSSEKVHVVDARTGASLLDYDLVASKSAKLLDLEFYRAMLFEKNGRLKVAVLPVSSDIDVSHPHPIPMAIIDVDSQKAVNRILPNKSSLNIARLENGHIYCFGAGLNVTNSLQTVFIRDISTDHYVLRRLQRVTTPNISLGHQELYLDANGNPEILLNQYQEHKIYRYDRKTNLAVEILSYPEGSRGSKVFRDSDGKIKIFTSKHSARREFTATLSTIDGTPPVEYIIPTKSENSIVLLNGTFKMPHGVAAVFVDADNFSTYSVSLIDLATGMVMTIPLRAGGLETLFYSPNDLKVLGFASKDTRTYDDFNLFQLWGADQ